MSPQRPSFSREDYLPPPLAARELGSRRAAVWRFRLVALLALLALVVVAILVFRALGGGGEGSPGIG